VNFIDLRLVAAPVLPRSSLSLATISREDVRGNSNGRKARHLPGFLFSEPRVVIRSLSGTRLWHLLALGCGLTHALADRFSPFSSPLLRQLSLSASIMSMTCGMDFLSSAIVTSGALSFPKI
jgi:hypothetical protein